MGYRSSSTISIELIDSASAGPLIPPRRDHFLRVCRCHESASYYLFFESSHPLHFEFDTK